VEEPARKQLDIVDGEEYNRGVRKIPSIVRSTVDTDTEKVMTKIEALLRKAESTNFGPESEALIAKAHELMARYSIEEAMLHKASGIRDEVIVLTIPVKRKGAVSQERHVLLTQSAKWQRCRAIITGDYMTVVGFKQDTEFVCTRASSCK
jgi:hypothetical protein